MDFDDKWIQNFDNATNKRPWTLKIFYFYIDKNKTIKKINQNVIEITNNLLTRDELVKLIIRNRKKHQLINVLTYIVKNIESDTNYSSFFNEINLQDIYFNDSNRLFESTNSLFLIFKETDTKENMTKRVRLTSSKKTRCKRFKASTTEL